MVTMRHRHISDAYTISLRRRKEMEIKEIEVLLKLTENINPEPKSKEENFINFLKYRAEIGDREAAYLLIEDKATSLEEKQKYLDILIHAANNNDGAAMLELSHLYGRSKLIENDPQKSFTFLQKSANSGYGEGLYWLGIAYHEGKLVKQDHQKALELFIQAIINGYTFAIDNIKEMYQNKIIFTKKGESNA